MLTPIRVGCGGAAHNASPETSPVDQSGSMPGAVRCWSSPCCSHRTAGRSPCHRTANDTVERGPVGMRCTSKLAPSQRRGIPADSNRPPSAIRCSIWCHEPPDRRTTTHVGERRSSTGSVGNNPSVTDPASAKAGEITGGANVAGSQRQPLARRQRSVDLGIARASDRCDRFDDLGHPCIGIVTEPDEFGHVEQESDRVTRIHRAVQQEIADRAAVNASASPASGSTTRLARWTTVSQPRTTAVAGTSVGSAQVPTRDGSCGTATRIDDRCPTGSTIEPGGRSRPLIGTSAGGRSVRTRGPANATANGSGDSFATSITVSPPRSGTDHTRCTASPSGIRRRVSITAVPSTRCWRTAGSPAGTCQRSSAATYHDTVASGPWPAPSDVTSPHGVTTERQGAPVTPTIVSDTAGAAPCSTALTPRIRPCGCAASTRRAHREPGDPRGRRRRPVR